MQNQSMNKKIIISISVIITILVIGLSITQIQTDNEQVSRLNENDVSNEKLEKIQSDKLENDNANQPYIPKEREWNSIGPFSIDRSEYVLGEKIFVNIKNTHEQNLKGQMAFVKIVNSTHVYEYKKIPFDFSKPQQNFYISIDLFDKRGICTTEQIIGDWEFRIIDEAGVGLFGFIEFEVLDQIMPGEEDRYESVC